MHKNHSISAQESKTSTFEDFKESFLKLPRESIRLDFLDQYLTQGSGIYLHTKTGVISSELKFSQLDSMNYWSNRIFTSDDLEDYTGALPFARARMYYVLRTLLDFVEKKKLRPKSLTDFATGEGVFLDLLSREKLNLRIMATEGSKDLCDKLQKKGYSVDNVGLGLGELPKFQTDLATVMWTLSCALKPYEILMEIRKNISPGGYLLIAESSRILVPFKKSLEDLFSKVHPADTHPYYFSKKSMCALLEITGFKPVYVNRYFDSGVLLVIAKKEESIKLKTSIDCDSTEIVNQFLQTWGSLTLGLFKDLDKNYSD